MCVCVPVCGIFLSHCAGLPLCAVVGRHGSGGLWLQLLLRLGRRRMPLFFQVRQRQMCVMCVCVCVCPVMCVLVLIRFSWHWHRRHGARGVWLQLLLWLRGRRVPRHGAVCRRQMYVQTRRWPPPASVSLIGAVVALCAGTGPLSCGTQCKCVDGTCTSNIPNPCAATRCFMNSQCGSTCACVQGKCTPKLPPPPAGNTFLKLLQDTYTTFNQVVGLVVASQLGELGLVSVSFEPTGGPQQDANTCNTSPPAAAYDALAGLSSTFIKQVLTDIASSSEVSNGAVADAVARSSSQTTIADNLGSLQANTALASAGLGMGFGFEVYCDGVQVYQYGSGVGGGMAAAPAPALSNGFGGGGGGDAGPNTTPPTLRGNRTAVPPASGTVYKIGGGGSCACSGGSCSCLPQTDPGQGTPVASMAPYMAAHCQLPSSQVVCISGGGGGGIQEAAPSCTWGGGWNMNACASGNPALPCTRICGGGGGGGGGGQPPTDPIGKVSATCNQQCVGQPAYYNCFCPCFKKGAQQAGAPWAAQIVCQAQQ